jgi:hypothetical protein
MEMFTLQPVYPTQRALPFFNIGGILPISIIDP